MLSFVLKYRRSEDRSTRWTRGTGGTEYELFRLYDLRTRTSHLFDRPLFRDGKEPPKGRADRKAHCSERWHVLSFRSRFCGARTRSILPERGARCGAKRKTSVLSPKRSALGVYEGRLVLCGQIEMKKAALFLDAPGPDLERQAKLFVLLYSAADVEARNRRIYEALLAQSPQIRDGNFRLIGTDDLKRLFDGYDREFFRGRLGEMLMEDEAHPITFRLLRRLVSQQARR